MQETMDPSVILNFWFSEEVKPKWFAKDINFDKLITEKFQSVYQAAKMQTLKHWQKTPGGCLALVIILDQFPRNMFRGLAKSFESDSIAVSINLSSGLGD